MKIGVLLPGSSTLPLIGYDFLDGLSTCLRHKNQDSLSVSTYHIGFGTDKEVIKTGAEKLLMEERADVLIAFADHPNISVLFPLMRSLNRLLIVVNSQAKYPESWKPEPSVIFLTLNNLLLSRLTGKLAAEKHTQAVLATSFYDGGYSLSHAITQGFNNQAEGIVYNFISKIKTTEFDVSPLTGFLQQAPAVRAILSIFSGDLAHLFCSELRQSGIPELEVYASPAMLDEGLTAQYGDLNIPYLLTGYVPWLSSLDNPENRIFCKEFEQTAKRKPNTIAALGWDTGMVLQTLANAFAAQQPTGRQIVEFLKENAVTSVRGTLQLDARTHHYLSPAYLVKADREFNLKITSTIQDITNDWEILSGQEQMGGTGWVNTYLCS